MPSLVLGRPGLALEVPSRGVGGNGQRLRRLRVETRSAEQESAARGEVSKHKISSRMLATALFDAACNVTNGRSSVTNPRHATSPLRRPRLLRVQHAGRLQP